MDASVPQETEPIAPENALQIFCRLRPPQAQSENGDETEDEQVKPIGTIELKSNTTLALRRPNSFIEQRYAFEHVFAPDCTQDEVYARAAQPLVESLLSGTRPQDALLFAYGATGSGKSYTIGGEPPDQPGIIPRIVDHLFGLVGQRLNAHYRIYPDNANYYLVSNRPSDQDISEQQQGSAEQFDLALCLSATERKRYQQSIQNWSQRALPTPVPPSSSTTQHIASRRYSIFVSFVEVYNNYIYDLLEQPPPGTSGPVGAWRRPPHSVRHDARHVVYVVGASELEVRDAEQAMRLFLLGVHNRATAATQLNAFSSRSHSIFTIKVVSYRDDASSKLNRLLDPNHLQVNQLAVVDLAGLERASRTKAAGVKLAEASNINNSLLTLRSCFDVLRQNQQPGAKYRLVPYRRHRLTFLLKSYFEEGRAQIRMIVCLKPAIEDLDENQQVLSFGKKAKEITIEQYCPPPKPPTPPALELAQLDSQGILDEKQSDSSSIVDLIELSLARFKYAEEKLSNSSFDKGEFMRELLDFVALYEQDFQKILRAFRKVVAQLSTTLKHYPERQADRASLVLAPYHLNLNVNFNRKFLTLQRQSVQERHSSCLFGLTEIAGTPIIPLRPSVRTIRAKLLTKGSMVDEFGRDLCIWESDSIDIAAKLGGQADALVAYATKQTTKPSTTKPVGDVFTRLYQQTPARYKYQPTATQASTNSTIRSSGAGAGDRALISKCKVANLKRFFTPEEPEASPSTKQPHVWKVSSRIASLASKLTSRDPCFVTKMAESVKWSSSEQSTRAMSMLKTAIAKNSSTAGKRQVKRQLF